MEIDLRTANLLAKHSIPAGMGDFVMFKPGVAPPKFFTQMYPGQSLENVNNEPTLTSSDVNLPAQLAPGFYPTYSQPQTYISSGVGPDGDCHPCLQIVPGSQIGCCPGTVTYQDNINPWAGNAPTTVDQIQLDPAWALTSVVPSVDSIPDATWTVDDLLHEEQKVITAQQDLMRTGVPTYVAAQGSLLGMGNTAGVTKEKKVALTKAVKQIEEMTDRAVANNDKVAGAALRNMILNYRTEINKQRWTDSSSFFSFGDKYETASELIASLGASQNRLIKLDNPSSITALAIDDKGRPVQHSQIAAAGGSILQSMVETGTELWDTPGQVARGAADAISKAAAAAKGAYQEGKENIDKFSTLATVGLVVAGIAAVAYGLHQVRMAVK